MAKKKRDIYWLNKDSLTFLKKGYLKDGQSAEDRIKQIAEAAEAILKKPGFAVKFEAYMRKGWYSLSSPIWANFGNGRGLPISCNGSYVDDNMWSILAKQAEVGMLTKYGAGTSGFFGALRPRGSKISDSGSASGPVHYLELFESVTRVVSQSNVRRGSFAAYLPVDHPDIEEFLGIREEGHPIQDISLGVCIPNAWMTKMINGDTHARHIWAKIVKKRFATGFPYIFFTDNVNNAAPAVYKNKGIKIHASNLCSEICLSSSPVETFVCNLSSLNLLHYEEWKNTDAVEILTYFLDAVMEDYIKATEHIPGLQAAHDFAKNQRALGIGVLGWHSLLQSRMIPFESMQAKFLNVEIHKLIQKRCYSASKRMAKEYGEPPLLKGYRMRNVTTMAIAPTTSSSFILGQVSPSIEPLESNYFTKDLAKGKFTYKNPYLQALLKKLDKDNEATWKSIMLKGGSVQHLSFLSEQEKSVFKTFGEISQKEIIIQASARQRYIDQGQSLNLMVPADVPAKEVSQLMIFAWEQGIKCLYYQRGANPAQQLGRSILECKSCEA
jgi:ribonucleoside-diphosphate reductase alpha chain